MSNERFNRQFILLDFKDLDNPEYLAFVRSPEFSTYLLMRRYVWRSTHPHHMGLETLYQQGFLTCSLDREKMAEQLGGVSIRTVTNDLTALERSESGLRQNLEAGHHSMVLRAQAETLRCDSGDAPAPFVNAAPTLGVHTIGHDHDERLTGGIDPQRGSGESGEVSDVGQVSDQQPIQPLSLQRCFQGALPL